MRPMTINPDDAEVAIHTRRPITVGAPRGRRRRTAIAVPRGRRHRGQAPRPQPGRADLQHRPFAATSKYLDRVSHPARSVRVRAAARRSLQRGVGRRTQGSRTADRAERRRTVGGRGEAIAFHSRPRHGRAGTASVSARHRAAPAIRQGSHRAGRRSRPCAAADRRAGPQHGIARCRRYRRYRARRDAGGRRSGLAAGARRATIRRGAPMSPAAPSRSTWRTARCSAISCRCSRCARPACI